MTKLRKMSLGVLVGLLVLMVVLLIFVQTPLFKNWLKDELASALSAATKSEISIGRLRGNLYSMVQFEDIRWQVDGTDFFTAKRLFIRYRPLALLLNRIEIRELLLASPVMFVRQKPDSSWNSEVLASAWPDGERAPSEADHGPRGAWDIFLKQCRIASATIIVDTPYRSAINYPERIDGLDIRFGFSKVADRMTLALQQMHLESRTPDFSLTTSPTVMGMAEDEVTLEPVDLQTEQSTVHAEMHSAGKQNPLLELLVRGSPVSFSELRRLFPQLSLRGSPQITVEVSGHLDDLNVRGHLRMGLGSIDLTGNIQALQEPYGYQIAGKMVSFDLSEIIADAALTTDLNMSFSLSGRGTEPGSMRAEFSVSADSSMVAGKRIGSSRVQGTIAGDTLFVKADVTVEHAELSLAGSVAAVGEALDYRVRGDVQHLDFGRFLAGGEMQSDLNLGLALSGHGTELMNMTGQLKVAVLPSSLQRIPIDSAMFHFTLAHGTLDFQRFAIVSPVGRMRAQGNLSLKARNALHLDAEFSDFSILSSVLPVDSLSGKGRLTGRIEGPADSMAVSGRFDFTQLGTSGFRMGTLSGEAEGLLSGDETRLSFVGQAHHIGTRTFIAEEAQLRVDYDDGAARYSLRLSIEDSAAVRCEGTVTPSSDSTLVSVQKSDVRYKNLAWSNRDVTARLRFHDSAIDFSHVELFSGQQRISLEGRLDTQGENRFHIGIEQVDLATVQDLLALDADIGGRLSVDIEFHGTMAAPRLKGRVQVQNGHSYQVDFSEVVADLDYAGERFGWRCTLSKSAGDSLLMASGAVPMQLAFRPFAGEIRRDQRFEFKASTRGIDLSLFQPLATGIKNIQGKVIADIVINNTLNDLRGVGPIRLIGGAFDIPEIGTKYRKINLVLVLNDKEVLIRDFRMRSGDGKLEIVRGSLSLSQDDVETFQALFKADNFQLMNNKKLRANVDGEIEVFGSIRSPQFSGDLTISECVVHYEEWFEDEAVYLTSKPFFVITDDTTAQDTAGAIRFLNRKRKTETVFSETKFYKRLRGELSLYFPRNVWIRSGDANIEIEGDLAAVKEGEDFVLFGSFATIRGFYQLFGNRFQIRRGEMVFNGNPDYNPEISIEASYVLPSASGPDGEKQEFEVMITGTMQSPEFHFTLDGEEVPQNDLISILVFGKRFADSPIGQFGAAQNANTTGNQSDSGPGLDERATGILTGQVLRQLSGKLSDELRLDVIQIERGKGWADASLRVGKYLTPDVFVSISQDFGDEGKQKIELEYEIPQKILFFNLLLQASSESEGNSALDFIWKIEW